MWMWQMQLVAFPGVKEINKSCFLYREKPLINIIQFVKVVKYIINKYQCLTFYNSFTVVLI